MQPSSNAPPGVCAIVSSEGLLRAEALARFLEALGDSLDPFGPVRVDGRSAGPAAVLDDVRTPSLMGHRVVIVDDADGFISAHRQLLEKYCAQPAPGGTLVLLCSTLPKNTKLNKIIDKQGRVLRCEAPRGAACIAWIVERARNLYGKRIAPGAARRLREHSGDQLGRLDSELSKLCTYVGERADITADDVGALTGRYREEKVFAVMDAIASGQPSEALHHWEQVLATDRAAPARAIGGLSWSVGQLLKARSEWEQGANLRALAPRFFTDADTLKRRLERAPRARLEQWQRDLLAADLAIKTGASGADVAIEKFIVRHAARAG